MKHYTMGFTLHLFSFFAILMLLYFGGLTRQVEKDVDIIKSQINIVNDKIQVNELEYVAHTSPIYLRKLEKIYLSTNYDENKEFNIVGIQDFKVNNTHKVFKINEKKN